MNGIVNWEAAQAILLSVLMAWNGARFYEDGSTHGAAISAALCIAFAVRAGTSKMRQISGQCMDCVRRQEETCD